MPLKDWTIRIEDMLDAAEKVAQYTHTMPDLETFASDVIIVDAAIRNVQIIGEAARHVPGEVQARYPDLDWGGMIGMRNILVHNYGAVRLDIVWGVVRTRIPPLRLRLREILERELPDASSPAE